MNVRRFTVCRSWTVPRAYPARSPQAPTQDPPVDLGTHPSRPGDHRTASGDPRPRPAARRGRRPSICTNRWRSAHRSSSDVVLYGTTCFRSSHPTSATPWWHGADECPQAGLSAPPVGVIQFQSGC